MQARMRLVAPARGLPEAENDDAQDRAGLDATRLRGHPPRRPDGRAVHLLVAGRHARALRGAVHGAGGREGQRGLKALEVSAFWLHEALVALATYAGRITRLLAPAFSDLSGSMLPPLS